jgi:hypothetical protein
LNVERRTLNFERRTLGGGKGGALGGSAALGGLGGDGGGGDVGPVAGFGAGVPEAGAVAAELGLGGVEEGALVDVGGVGRLAERGSHEGTQARRGGG